ncbi:MAG TPA: hypothetical protein VD772_05940, partial [Anseongella sp.]|nr:hypothetical protein [Anseongella sp.]
LIVSGHVPPAGGPGFPGLRFAPVLRTRQRCCLPFQSLMQAGVCGEWKARPLIAFYSAWNLLI